jgi:hypothetical protein
MLSLSGLLGGLRWFKTDVSELPFGPIFKGQAVREESLNCLILLNNPEDGSIPFSTAAEAHDLTCCITFFFFFCLAVEGNFQQPE